MNQHQDPIPQRPGCLRRANFSKLWALIDQSSIKNEWLISSNLIVNTWAIFSLPRFNVPQLSFPCASASRPGAAGSADFAMNRPILIIEDDPDIAEVLAYALQKEQFVTRVALTGEEGLVASLDRSNPPAIILLDLLLPAMTGSELCRRLRQETTTAFTPIIIITAKAFELDGANYLKLGANDYIVKPFSIGDVIRRVRSFLPGLHVDSRMPPPSAPG